MNFVKSTLFSGLSTIIKVSSGFISGKIAAIFIGPSGVAVMGAFNNLVNIGTSLSNGAIISGVVKYTSEYSSDLDKLKSLWSTILKVVFLASLIVSGFLILFSGFISEIIFKDIKYKDLISLLGLAIVFISINTILVAIVNGLQKIRDLTFINIITNIFGLVLTIAAIYLYNLKGALIALVFTQAIGFLVSFLWIYKFKLIDWTLFLGKGSWSIVGKLGSYSFMAILAAFTIPVSQIVLRNLLISKFGLEQAGYWQASLRISEGYLMVLSTSLATYYLPKLSSLSNSLEIKNEVFRGLKFIIPIVLISSILVYVFKTPIISILFTNTFYQVENFILWQLIGDVLKMSAWIFAYLMLAKSMVIPFVISEIGFNLIYIGLTFLLVNKIGVIGVSISYAIGYLFYLIFMLLLFRDLLMPVNK